MAGKKTDGAPHGAAQQAALGPTPPPAKQDSGWKAPAWISAIVDKVADAVGLADKKPAPASKPDPVVVDPVKEAVAEPAVDQPVVAVPDPVAAQPDAIPVGFQKAPEAPPPHVVAISPEAPPAPPPPDPAAPKTKFKNQVPPPAAAQTTLPCMLKATLQVKVTDIDVPTRLIPNANILIQDASDAEVSRGVSTLTDEYQSTEVAPGTYKVTISFAGQDAITYKIEAPGPTQSQALAGGDTKLLEFKVTPMIRIYLKFQFQDPDENFADKVRVFPKDMKLQLFMTGTEKIEAVIGDDGIMLDGPGGKNYIEVKRSKKWFEVKFEQPKRPFVMVEAYDTDTVDKPKLVEEDAPFTKDNDLQKKIYDDKKRVFMFPKTKWTMKNSDWDVNQAPTFTNIENKFERLEMLGTIVGEDGSPAVCTLDPHWQYIKFEYFDRYFGISDHNKEPITSLPVFLEGYETDVTADENPAIDKLTTLANWAVTKDKDTTKLVQVLPWIIRTDDANKENANPNQKSVLRFKTDEKHRFLKSTEKDKREWKELKDTDTDYKPIVDRLRYYDLPEEWRSMQYFCRFSKKEKEQEYYEEMARRQTTQAIPLIFSLDDIVLTDKDLKPIEWRWEETEVEADPNDRVAIFRNTFEGDSWSTAEPTAAADPAGPPTPPTGAPPVVPAVAKKPAGARTPADKAADRRADLPKKPQGPSEEVWHSPEGIYRHDKANKMPYYSRIKLPANYVADYSGWIRLVAAKGNLYDVFHKRTKFDSAKPKLPTGARAGVAWVDATAAGVGAAAGANKPSPSLVKDDTKHPYYTIQPFYGSEFVTKGMPRAGSNFYDEWTTQIGVGDNTFTNGRSDLALIRCCEFDGTLEKSVLLRFQRFTFDFDAEASNIGAGDDARKTWRSNFLADCGSRWSGNDGVNSEQTWLYPKAGATTFKIKMRTFVQAYEVGAASLKSNWCHFKIKTVEESKTSSMNAGAGTGQLRGDAGLANTTRGFAGAHETGHAHGQPDEYPSNASAYGEKAWGSNHIPGAPFNLDRPAASAMMVGNRAVRPRSFWTLTEWLKNNIADMGVDFKIEHGAESNYCLPHYQNGSSHPGRAFNYWPMRAYTRYHSPADVIYDSYLYQCGKEIFTTQVLPNASDGAPVDGILLILLNVGLTFSGFLAEVAHKTRREAFAKRLVSRFEGALNNKVFAQFDLGPSRSFAKCYVHFTMRLSETATTSAHLNFNIDPEFAGSEDAVSDRWDYNIEFPVDTPPPTEPEWTTAINGCADKVVVEALKRIGLGTAGATDYMAANAYIPIVKSIGSTLSPTMTRL